MTESEQTQGIPEHSPGAYERMFQEYLAAEPWAMKSENLLVRFHVEQLCRHIDSGGLANAAMSSAYLKAIMQLERRRPGHRQDLAGDGGSGSQTSIFDHLEDD